MAYFSYRSHYGFRLGLVLAVKSASWPAAAAAETAATILPAIAVTANKLSESLQDTPQTVSVFSGDELRERNVRRLDDLLRLIPNASMANVEYGSAVADWNYRGLNVSLFEKASPLLVYIDGVPQSDRFSLAVDIDDIERVEVLRGPSGTLHGSNAMGGVIYITTRSGPANAVSGSVRSRVGSHGTAQLGASVQVPLAGIGSFKLNAAKQRYDGVLTRAFPGGGNEDREDEQYVNAALKLAVGERGLIDYVFSDDNRRYGYGRLDVVDRAGLNDNSNSNRNDFDLPSAQRNHNTRHLLKGSYEAGPGRLEWLASLTDNRHRGVFDCDYGPAPLYRCGADRNTRNTATELRWVVDHTPLKWIIGAYANRETQHWGDNSFSLISPPLDLLQTQGTLGERTGAIFGQATIPLWTDWQATVGGRWQRVERKVDVTIHSLDASFRPFAAPLQARKTMTVFLPKLGLSWAFRPQQTVFAGYSEGYLPGGFNVIYPVSDPRQAEYQPQRSRQIELGYKGRPWPGLQASSTLFYARIDDIQATERLPTGYRALNLAGAASKGIEFELVWQPNARWQADANIGLISAHYRSGSLFRPSGATTAIDLGGRRVEKTPTATALLGLQTNRGPWFGRAEMHYLGTRPTSAEGDAQLAANTRWNLRGGYRTRAWEVAAYVLNLTDRKTALGAYRPDPSGQPERFVRVLDRPRTFGVEARYAF